MAIPTIRDGQVQTKGTKAINPDRHVVDMRSKIYTLDSGSNPALRSLTMRGQTVSIESFNPKWLEDQPVPEADAINNGAGYTSGDTAIVVDNGAYHKAGDVIYVPRTQEYLLVSSVSTNTLTVVRSFGDPAAAALVDNDPILNLGLVDFEGNTSPVAKQTISVTLNNFTRILKTPVDLSRTLSQTKLYGGSERGRLRVKAGVKHARLLELEFFHGTRSEDATGAQVRRSAGGLDFFVTTNILDAAGLLSESEFYEWLGTVYRNGVDGATSSRRCMFAGQALINTISMWGQNKLQTDSGRNQRYGFSISTLLTPYGELDIVYHPLLEGGFAGYGYVCDMSGLMIGRLQPTVLETNIQAPDVDGYKDQYLSEQTYFVINQEAFGIVKGVVF